MSPATACWPGRMWRARAPSQRSGSTRSRPGASRRSPTCRRSAPPAWPAPLWDGRCTKAALPSSRRSSARPRDGRPGAAAHDRTGRAGVAPVEPHDVELCPGSERRPAAGAARRVAQHGGARRTLARSARHGACAGTGRRCHLALRVAGARVRLFAPRGRRDPARPGARRRRRAGGAGGRRDRRRDRRRRRPPLRPAGPRARDRPAPAGVVRCVRFRYRGTEGNRSRGHRPAQGQLRDDRENGRGRGKGKGDARRASGVSAPHLASRSHPGQRHSFHGSYPSPFPLPRLFTRRLAGARSAAGRRGRRFRAARRRPLVGAGGEPAALRGAARGAARLGQPVPRPHTERRGARAGPHAGAIGVRRVWLARRGTPGDRAVTTGRRAARRGRSVRAVPLGVPRRRQRRGVSGGGRGLGRLAADGGRREMGEVRPGDARGSQRDADRVALDGVRTAAGRGRHADGWRKEPHRYAAIRCDRPSRAVAAPGRVRVRSAARGGAGRRRGGDVLRRVAPRGAARAGPAGWRTGPTGELGAARSLVAVRGRDRCGRDGVGVAAPAGAAVLTPLWQRLSRVFGRRDAGAREEAERILLEADFGVAATAEILEQVARTPDGDARPALEQAVVSILSKAGAPGALARAPEPPTVILVFGVNGVGKTTTIAKLAHRLAREGRSVLLAAADTFRAGAREQLEIWADRLGVPCIRGTGADPAAVAFDAVAAARARGVDSVLVDTAGRLHTEERLLGELKKVVRVVAKQRRDAPHESLLVLDATVGQNAVHQAQAFAAALPLTGLIVTKLDGTAKGGSVVAVQRAIPVPVRFIGIGEGLDDLDVFDAESYAKRLVGG